MRITNATIVAKAPFTDSVGVIQYSNAQIPLGSSGRTRLANCLIIGWASATAHGARYVPAWDPNCTGNATSAPESWDGHTLADPGHFGVDVVADVLPGAGGHFHVPYDKTTFADPAADWRTASPALKGIGIQL